MYKEKKVSKFALICCSFLIAISSMLAFNPSWLNNVYGTTLCASSTAPTVDSTWFDITNSNFVNNIDYVTEYYSFTANGTYAGVSNRDYITITLNNVGSNLPTHSALSPTAITGTIYNYNQSIVDGSYSIATSSINSIYAGSNYVKNTIVILSNISNLNLNNSFIIFKYNDVYYTVCCSSLYNSYLTYVQYSSSNSTSYNEGFLDGQNHVINNPNNFDLYNQSQFDANYTNGYNVGYSAGYNAGQAAGINLVLNNPSQYGLYTQEQYNSNYDNGYRIGQEDIDADPNSYGYYTNTQYQLNYVRGYDEGRIVGIDTVLNNPSRYDLYTQEDMDARYETGFTDGETVGYADGYTNGYSDGVDAGISRDISFKNLIYAVVDVPVETVRSLFNFDLLGFNLFNLFTALFTLMFLIILIKFFMRSK